MTGETLEAINKRIQRGVWREGSQVLKIEGVKERWIDLLEVNAWARRNRRLASNEKLEPNWVALDESEPRRTKKK
ncbi:TPA: excisionase [Yersinia enterocolitica]